MVNIISVSYCWCAPWHPDESGEQLRHLVATLEEHASSWREAPFRDMGVFIDWASLYQKDPALFDKSQTPEAQPTAEAKAAFEQALKDGAAFYGGEAYEASRSEEEKAAFRHALHETMDLWCALPALPSHHHLTTT